VKYNVTKVGLRLFLTQMKVLLAIFHVDRNVSMFPYTFLYFETPNGHIVCVGSCEWEG